jgi:hypothetical protein
MTDEEDYIDPSLDDYDIHKLENKPVGLEVYIESTLVDAYREDEEYGDWREEYYNFFKSARITTTHPDVVTKLPLKPGDEVYVVWVEWDTGDSFGRAECESTETIGVFYDLAAAEELERFLWDSEHYDNINGYGTIKKELADKNITNITLPHNTTYKYIQSSGTGSVTTTLHTSDGQEFAFSHFPWCGYFDKLATVYVTQTEIQYVN